jgi:basic amino acid/polyamine antiporter, APA family
MKDQSAPTLLPALGPVQLIMLGVGCIIGAGIFVITGSAAAQFAGPAIVLSFLFAALACGCAGLCYAEMAAMSPGSGGAYSYARDVLGPLTGWLVGWTLILEYLVAASFVAVGWSAYLSSFLSGMGIHLPAAIASAPFAVRDGHLIATQAIINVPALVITGLATFLAVIGVQRSSFANVVIVVIKIAVILLVIGIGSFYVNPALWTPFIPENQGSFGHYGVSGILRGAGVVFIAYIGFDAVATTALEARKPQRDVPIGILGSLLVCTVLYVAMALVLTGIVPYTELKVDNPVAFVVERMGPGMGWLKILVSFGALAGLTSVMLVLLVAQPRVFLAMAQHRILPAPLARVHATWRTPHVATLTTGATAAVLAALFPIDLLAEMVSIGTLLAFIAVAVSVMVLRLRRPDAPRPFRAPVVWLVAPLSVLVCGYLMLSLPQGNWWRLLIWLLIGLVIYAIQARRHRAMA